MDPRNSAVGSAVDSRPSMVVSRVTQEDSLPIAREVSSTRTAEKDKRTANGAPAAKSEEERQKSRSARLGPLWLRVRVRACGVGKVAEQQDEIGAMRGLAGAGGNVSFWHSCAMARAARSTFRSPFALQFDTEIDPRRRHRAKPP